MYCARQWDFQQRRFVTQNNGCVWQLKMICVTTKYIYLRELRVLSKKILQLFANAIIVSYIFIWSIFVENLTYFDAK